MTVSASTAFIAPTNFSEFQQRFPRFLRSYLRNRPYLAARMGGTEDENLDRMIAHLRRLDAEGRSVPPVSSIVRYLSLILLTLAAYEAAIYGGAR